VRHVDPMVDMYLTSPAALHPSAVGTVGAHCTQYVQPLAVCGVATLCYSPAPLEAETLS
jgi:hypothetical protein